MQMFYRFRHAFGITELMANKNFFFFTLFYSIVNETIVYKHEQHRLIRRIDAKVNGNSKILYNDILYEPYNP